MPPASSDTLASTSEENSAESANAMKSARHPNSLVIHAVATPLIVAPTEPAAENSPANVLTAGLPRPDRRPMSCQQSNTRE